MIQSSSLLSCDHSLVLIGSATAQYRAVTPSDRHEMNQVLVEVLQEIEATLDTEDAAGRKLARDFWLFQYKRRDIGRSEVSATMILRAVQMRERANERVSEWLVGAQQVVSDGLSFLWQHCTFDRIESVEKFVAEVQRIMHYRFRPERDRAVRQRLERVSPRIEVQQFACAVSPFRNRSGERLTLALPVCSICWRRS
jgi:hypothetical protein